jgi:hypothetical protein
MMIATSAFLDLFQSPIQVPHADALLLLAFLVVAWCAPHLGELAFGPIERTWRNSQREKASLSG